MQAFILFLVTGHQKLLAKRSTGKKVNGGPFFFFDHPCRTNFATSDMFYNVSSSDAMMMLKSRMCVRSPVLDRGRGDR